jgi:hypothetical protein
MRKVSNLDIFLGVQTSDLPQARLVCEDLIGKPMRCTNSSFYGGDHCHATVGGVEFSLRLNHHDDGDGWSWCIQDQRFPLVLGVYSRNPADAAPFLERIKYFDLLVDTRAGGPR